ncbi:MAG: TIGR02186 family protein [Rhodospirillales bacterium]|nr:TIGR02186 family protein [Rhodospirillales bacterium]
MSRLLAALVLLLCAAAPAQGQPLVADLSSHLIGITTSFTGTSVVLFGAVDGPGDVVAVVRGPTRDVVVRRKSRVGPIWINTRQVTFKDVPGYYAVVASRPIEEAVPPPVRSLHQIGLSELSLTADRERSYTEEFRAALVRSEAEAGLFLEKVGSIDFLGDRLFRATLVFPANVPTGTYSVEIFLLRNGEVVSAQTTPLVVSKIGMDARLFDFADRQALAYGLVAVLIAVMAGWLASLPFRSA